MTLWGVCFCGNVPMESKKSLVFLDISSEYPNTTEFTFVSNEFNRMLVALNRVGVNVFLADQKYFPIGHRGVYHTVGNNFFLNKNHMGRPHILMSVMRHEGWHAAQDCMAGSIENSLIAIIKPEDEVPMVWRVLASVLILPMQFLGKQKHPGQERLKV